MQVNSQSAATMTPLQRSVHAELLEAPWHPISSEGDSRAEPEVNHSAPIEACDSTSGVCNELARIAMNRSAVMQVYESMFPRREPLRPGWVQRTLGVLRGRSPR